MKKIDKLNEQELSLLLDHLDVLSFSYDFDLVYEKQVPNTGVAVVAGEVEITKKSRAMETISAGGVIGVPQLYYQEPVKMGARVKKNSQVILIAKSDIEDALKNKDSGLFLLMNKIIGDNEEG
jgi:signal-transduction protein with cAMP-binding, CBS, and nucleotidyltransferase domain